MKKIILSIFSFVTLSTLVNAQSQVGIGIETQTVGERAILDFPENANKGILLPRLKDNGTAGNTSGTLVYNTSTKSAYFYGENEWIAFTDASMKDISNNSLYKGEELDAEGVVIEDGTGGVAPVGVLSLESNERALVLPVVKDVTLLPNPIAGIVCYDKKSSSLAIFNGTEWYFWR